MADSGLELPPPLVRLLGGNAPPTAEGTAFALATVGESGWPHLALLSVGELLAVSPSELRLALHRGSGTTANVRRDGRALLHAVADGRTWTVRLAARLLADEDAGGVELACFAARVAGVSEHRAEYVEVTSGITFALTDPSARERWRRTHALLRRL